VNTLELTIQEQDLRIPDQGSRDAQTLPLAAAKIRTFHPHIGIQALLQPTDEVPDAEGGGLISDLQFTGKLSRTMPARMLV
jgi:hypothetical protein